MQIKSSQLAFILIFLTLFSSVQTAKSASSAILGKLVPAIIKCFGGKILGLGGMSKVIHIIEKASHGFDKLSPADIVYDVVEVVVRQAPWTKFVSITLTGGKIVLIAVKVMSEGVGIGTGYIVEEVAHQIERRC